MNQPMGHLEVVAFDCPDAEKLATFYRSIIGGQLRRHAEGGWVEIHTAHGNLAFQHIEDYRPPTWPTGPTPQQAHIDIAVEDLDSAETEVLGAGARKADIQPDPEQFRVYLDPAGHPFCCVRPYSGTVLVENLDD